MFKKSFCISIMKSSVLLIILLLTFVMSLAIDRIITRGEIELLKEKMCDNSVPKEKRGKYLDCLEEKLPFVMLEAVDSCTYEVMPNAATRDEITASLCSDESVRAKLHKCLQTKRKDVAFWISRDEMREKFQNYKTCVNNVTDTLSS